MGKADANKRINLAAPLLSVRRHGGGGGETAAMGLPVPAYKAAGAASEPPGHTTSAVPFGWEHRPGHPKSVRTRRPPPPPPPLTTVDVGDEPSRVARDPAAVECARGEADALSRDDDVSCVTVNCSAAGLSDAAVSACAGTTGPCAARGSGSGGVMMDRFLPAAHAVAAGSPQNTFRKAGSSARAAAVVLAGGERLAAQQRVPLHHIAAYHYHLPPLLLPAPSGKNNEDGGRGDDDDNSDAHSTAGFASSKSCGLHLLSIRCVKSALLLSGGGSRREKKPLLPPLRSCNGQQKFPNAGAGDDHGMQCWEQVYIESLLRSGPGGGGVMGPAAAVVSELDRTVRELYKSRDGRAVRPKASHLGLLLVLDRSNEACGAGDGSPARKLSRTGDTTLLLKATGEKQLGRDAAADVAGAGGGGYGFPLLLEDKEAVAGREMALSPQPLSPLLPLPLPKSPTESWLSRALPSVSTRPPPATSFLGLHVQPKKRAPLPWCSNDSTSRDVRHDRQRQVRVHDLQK